MRQSTPETRFVVLSAREEASVSANCLRAAARDVDDWQAVARLACDHRLAAYVRAACARGEIALPASATETLQAEVRGRAMQVLLLNAELARLARAMDAARFAGIVLKGPALARMLYSRAEQRPYGDIDLLVSEANEGAAADLLEASGYVEAAYAAEEARLAQKHHVHVEGAYHRMFVSVRTGTLVELHTDPLQLGLRPVCEADRWRRATSFPDLPAVKMLCATDQIVQLSVHAHKHGFERLIWLKDIDLLVRHRSDELDWHLIASSARAEGVTVSVWLALDLARQVLATPVPAASLGVLQPAPPLRAFVRTIWSAPTVAALEGRMRRRAVQFHAAESWRGTLPSLVVMGRRRDRLGAITESLARACWSRHRRSHGLTVAHGRRATERS